jgi:hypothetical protein
LFRGELPRTFRAVTAEPTGSRRAGRGSRSALLAIAALALILAGCFKADVDLVVGHDGTVSGTLYFGYSLRNFAEWDARQARERAGILLESLTRQHVAGMRCRSSDDDDYAGVVCTLRHVAHERLGSIDVEGSRLWFEADDDQLTVHGAVDANRQMPPDGRGYRVDVRIRFPGRIVGESTGEVDGNTVSWSPPAGFVTRILATGTVPGLPQTNVSPPHGVSPAAGLGVLVLLLAGALAAVRLRSQG